MDKERYNGWANYATWAVKLWIDNTEGSYNYWQEQMREHLRSTPDKNKAAYALANQLKHEHEEAAEAWGAGASVFADILRAGMSEVDWTEIAEAIIGDATE